MPDNKLTDNEIIKALKEILEIMCVMGDLQKSATISKALDLINRLQARVEKAEKVEHFADKTIATLQTENEHLKKEIENLESMQEIPPEAKHFVDTKADKVISLLNEVIKSQEQIKGEAYKECIEKVKNAILPQLNTSTLEEKETYYFCLNILDNLLKEMVGDKNGNAC